MSRYVCVHGHFYQPPRENPWLEAVERQPTAAPFHDWNERVTAECYRPNASARLLDDRERITRIVSNYARMSFNVGPTLLTWLDEQASDVYGAILRADEVSRDRFSGHGSALAQAYGHMIMPLADERDRRTQVRWGVRDFERRFGRSPEGMWLPETAVDLASLEALAAEGILFTILAPHQARRVRPLEGGDWRGVDERSLDTGRAYLQKLPSGRSIVLFFYHGALARGVAFEGLLESGSTFASRLLEVARAPGPGEGRLAHLAADGETYGHHHRFGEMALAAALTRVEETDDVRLTNYGEFLDRHPPELEVEIAENTSWSCVHGIERWRSDCGCHTGGEPGWTQAWRAPLRRALDGLRDDLSPRFESAAARVLKDPWAARDAYLDVVLDRDRASVESFLGRHALPGAAGGAGAVQALRLLEMERQLQLMYTSCGWFFNDLAGIETLQVLAYAARALELARLGVGDASAARDRFLSTLSDARSNRPELGSGADLWTAEVLPRAAGIEDAAANWSVRCLLEGSPTGGRFYAWEVEAGEERRVAAGQAELALGTVSVRSRTTREAKRLRWSAIRVGELSVTCGLATPGAGEEAEAGQRALVAAVEEAELTAALRLLEESHDLGVRSVRDLWAEERRRTLVRISERALDATAEAARMLYERRAPLLRALTRAGLPVPALWEAAGNLVLEGSLGEILRGPTPDASRVRKLMERAARAGVRPDATRVRRDAGAAIDAAAARFAEGPFEEGRLEALVGLLEAVRVLPFEVGLRSMQDRWWEVRERLISGEGGVEIDAAWREAFRGLGERLRFAVEAAD